MWHCSQCGEGIKDEFNVCWRCGTNRDGTAPVELVEDADGSTAPGPLKSCEPDQAMGDDATPGQHPGTQLTQEGLATLLLRFLGLWMAAFGIIGFAANIGRLFFEATSVGLDQAFKAFRHYQLEPLIWPIVELVAGLYFLVGGQWVYERILTPIRRRSEDYESETDEDGLWRTWRSADGKFVEHAKLIRVAGETVHLLKEDGSRITVARAKLSEDDWLWATRQGIM